MKKTLLISIILSINIFANAQAGTWADLYIFANAAVVPICFDPSNNVYAAGYFNNGGDTLLIEKWNGSQWSHVGAGLSGFAGAIYSMCYANGKLYAAGTVNDGTYAYVACWDGSTWSPLGTGNYALGANDVINAICSDPAGNIYAAGKFTNMQNRCCVTKWNGTYWTELGAATDTAVTPYAGVLIYSLFCDGAGNIYAGTSDGVAKWDGTSWHSLGGYIGLARSVCADTAGNVYAGGGLQIGGDQILGKWNGLTWTALSPTNICTPVDINTVQQICLDKAGKLYAVGKLCDFSGYYVATYSGTSYGDVGAPDNNLAETWSGINSVAVDNNFNVYIGLGSTDGGAEGVVRKYKVTQPTSAVPEIGNNTAEIKIYPNPTAGDLTIDGLNIGQQLKLCDAYGRMLQSYIAKGATMQIDVSQLSAGIYFINGKKFVK